MSIFQIKTRSQKSKARRGVLNLAHGQIQTPVFMSIGTVGSVKSLTTWDLIQLDAEIILGNTYHLWLRPGMETIFGAGGYHRFINWDRPVLTDSGGFQAWSLTKTRTFSEEGVFFRSHIDGRPKMLTPEMSMQIQTVIGSDIALVLDHVVNAESDKQIAKEAMLRTARWAQRSRDEFDRLKTGVEIDLGQIDGDYIQAPEPNKKGQVDLHQLAKFERIKARQNKVFIDTTSIPQERYLFGIPQGAQFKDLRIESAKRTMDIGFPGYCIGGVAQGGEPEEVMYDQVLTQTEVLEDEKPRHLLGVGTPKDIIEMVKRGIDMFDCVYPTRNARHGSLFVWLDREKLEYETIKIGSSRFIKDYTPIKSDSKFIELRDYSKAYLHHLFGAKELLAYRLMTLNNLEFYYQLMQTLRDKIQSGDL